MKLGELKYWKAGKTIVVRFPVKLCDAEDAPLMAGMWLLENYVEERCEDKLTCVNVIADRMRKHIVENQE